MPLRFQTIIKSFTFFDLLVMAVSFFLATCVSYSQVGMVSFDEFLSMRIKIGNFLLFLGFLILWHLIFFICGLYNSRRLSTLRTEIKDIVKATSLGTFSVFILANLFEIYIVTPLFLTGFWLGSTALTISSRLALRYAFVHMRPQINGLRYILIVGTNKRAMQFAQEIVINKNLGYRLLGFVDEGWKGSADFRRAGYEVVTSFPNFPSFLKDHIVDEVIITIPLKSMYQEASQVVASCEEQGILVKYNQSNIFDLKLAHTEIEDFEGEPLTSHYTGAMRGWQLLVKRIMDIILSLALLLFLSPLFLLIAFLIKITSPGPIFFIQDRVGVNKRTFRLYKFRTMVPNAEKKQLELENLNEVSGPVFKIQNDPRITLFGKFLRKTSVDELPQLVNVLKGDVSLVGPRPLPIRDYEGFEQDWHRRRFSVRPGITCLWQIHGRSSIPFEKWMELDMQYIDNWSLWLDLKIMAMTLPAVLRGSGAT